MIRRYIPKSTEELAEWYMRYVSPLSLIAGFILDTLFLARRVDLFLTNALLFSYLLIAAFGILLINLIQNGHLRHHLYLKALPLLPVVAQFAFGGLFSAYLSLYSRSAAVSVSWIFIVVLVVLIIGNERFAHFYARPLVQISLYFTVLFSFLSFFLPVIFREIGPWMFLGSGVVALVIMGAFLALLFKLIPEMREHRGRSMRTIGVIFIVFNVLYFTNAIPPLPLALKGAGVYHSIVKTGSGSYTLMGEAIPWYERYFNYAPTFHATPDAPVFVLSSVFAPSGLTTKILHEWQFYNPEQKEWRTTNTVAFPIQGGRDGGYRGYSQKIDPAAGKWRVNVITQYGQLIGRIAFTVVEAVVVPTLVETKE